MHVGAAKPLKHEIPTAVDGSTFVMTLLALLCCALLRYAMLCFALLCSALLCSADPNKIMQY